MTSCIAGLSLSIKYVLTLKQTLTLTLGVTRRPFSSSSCWSGPAPVSLLELKELDSDADHRLAEGWAHGFRVQDIPKGAYDVTYARSSGAGGQVSVAFQQILQASICHLEMVTVSQCNCSSSFCPLLARQYDQLEGYSPTFSELKYW